MVVLLPCRKSEEPTHGGNSMTTRTFTIHNKTGLHARPATLFVQTAAHFKSRIKVTREGRTVDAKSILGVLSLGAGKDATVDVSADGIDETEALIALDTLLTKTIGEDE
jgi:phosphocarrier protein HPr